MNRLETRQPHNAWKAGAAALCLLVVLLLSAVFENGADYLGIMEKNLETLKIALNK